MNPAATIHITEAEGEVLEPLWRLGPLPPMRLFAEVKARRPWGEATIKTLLGRLMRKHAVRSERIDGRLLYHPMIDRDAYLASEVDDLVRRLFGGDVEQLRRFLTPGPTIT
jgi:predicted transcriptional regulator